MVFAKLVQRCVRKCLQQSPQNSPQIGRSLKLRFIQDLILKGAGIMMVAVAASLLTLNANAGTELKFNKARVNALSQVSLATFSDSNLNQHQYWIVQFKDVITEATKQNLVNSGAKVFRYIPDDALVIKLDGKVLKSWVANRHDVQQVMTYQGDHVVSEFLPTASVFNQSSRLALVVQFFDVEAAQLFVQHGVAGIARTSVRELDGKFVNLITDLTGLSKISKIQGIEFIQPEQKFETMDMNFSQDANFEILGNGDYTDLTGGEAGTKVMNFEQAWAAGLTGNGQVVGMADTGLDQGDLKKIHDDFSAAIVSGYAFGTGATTWEDTNGHGTHVAGSVLSRGTTSGGKIKGGAYQAKLVAEGLWSPLIDNLSLPAKLDVLFETAKKDGGFLHTNSWGSAANLGAYDTYSQKVDEFLFNNQDFLILFAAGNSGVDKNKDGKIDQGSIASPGTSKNSLTVGASENLEMNGGIQKKISELRSAKDLWPTEPIYSSKLSDNQKGIAVFSSRGPTRDGRIKPEIVAPGTNILSTKSQDKNAGPLWGLYNSFYAWCGGTSMATPLTAGAAAVTREALIKKWGIAMPMGSTVKAMLLHTSQDIFPGQYGMGKATQELLHRPEMNQGYGRVDVGAIAMASANTKIVESAGLATGEEAVVEVDATKSLLVNLVWTDAPGAPAAAKTLVNDLDLVVIDPSGKEITAGDHINNNEIVELDAANSGKYTIKVRGVNVPMGKSGKQPYSLVYTSI